MRIFLTSRQWSKSKTISVSQKIRQKKSKRVRVVKKGAS